MLHQSPSLDPVVEPPQSDMTPYPFQDDDNNDNQGYALPEMRSPKGNEIVNVNVNGNGNGNDLITAKGNNEFGGAALPSSFTSGNDGGISSKY